MPAAATVQLSRAGSIRDSHLMWDSSHRVARWLASISNPSRPCSSLSDYLQAYRLITIEAQFNCVSHRKAHMLFQSSPANGHARHVCRIAQTESMMDATVRE